MRGPTSPRQHDVWGLQARQPLSLISLLPHRPPPAPLCACAAGDVRFEAETIDFFTRKARTQFRLSEVKPLPDALRPFVTFEANGRLYFVHGETFDDKELLKRLVGRPLKPSELPPSEAASGEGQKEA
jgi:hypothetical protein